MYEIPDANPFQRTKKCNTKMQRGKEKKQKPPLFTLDNLHSKETATIPRNSYNYLMGVAMGTKYFLVGPNNRNSRTRGNGCELGGSGWTLGSYFFTRAVVHNHNRLPRRAVEVQSLEVFQDLPRQSHTHTELPPIDISMNI